MKKNLSLTLKRIVVSTLVVCLLASTLIVFAGCSDTKETKYVYKYEPPIYNNTQDVKKAIIILPGAFGSNLINDKTNEPLWSGGALMNNLFMTRDRLSMEEITGFFKSFMEKDDKGNNVNPVRAANMNDQYLQFGLIDEYRNLYKYFNNNYGKDSKLPDADKYDVLVYQYDWTKSAKDSALELEQFVKANKYEQNILVGHSLGGIVIDYYLTNEANRNITDGFISLGTPHYGIMDTLLMGFASANLTAFDLPNILDLLGLTMDEVMSLMDSMGGLNLKDKLPLEFKDKPLEFVKSLATEMMSLFRGMPSLYDMMPSKELFDDGNIKINNESITYDEFIQKASLIPAIKDNVKTKLAFETAVNNRKELYIGTEQTFVAEIFNNNTYYIAGQGKKDTLNTTSLNFILGKDNSLNIKPNKENIKRSNSFVEHKVEIEGEIYVNYLPQNVGDSIVLIKSATLSKPDSEANVTYLKGFFDHIDLYSPVSVKDGSHFLPIMEPNEIGDTLKDAMKHFGL